MYYAGSGYLPYKTKYNFNNKFLHTMWREIYSNDDDSSAFATDLMMNTNPSTGGLGRRFMASDVAERRVTMQDVISRVIVTRLDNRHARI